MEITPKDTVNIDAYVNQVQEKDKADAASEQPEKQQAKADTVVLSDTAKAVQEAKTQLDSVPDVREDKVAELREQIENGTYEVDSEKLAEKMITDSIINELT